MSTPGAASAHSTSLAYMPGLDGLRALAVTAVLVSHWSPIANRFGHLGLAGVYIFFVLSGFLITSILLNAREQWQRRESTLHSALLGFYGRRALRIFPIYYLTVIVSYLIWPKLFGTDLPWNLSYLSNVQAMLLGRTTAINHFWSLSVEEQYYLFWPLLVLLTPLHRLWTVVLVLIAVSPVWRALAIAADFRHIVYSYAVWSNLDSLGIGSALAIAQHRNAVRDAIMSRLGVLGGVAWLGCAITTYAVLGRFRLTAPGAAWASIFILYPLAVSLVAVLVIQRVAQRRAGIVGRLLSAAPLRGIGIVSYGVYIYHFFVQGVFDHFYTRAYGQPMASFPRILVLIALTVLIASISYFAIERPLRSLRTFLPQGKSLKAANS